MSASYFVYTLNTDNERIRELQEVYDSCRRLGVTVPPEISRLVEEGRLIEGLGLVADIPHKEINGRHWNAYLVNVSDIPKDANAIAFMISY